MIPGRLRRYGDRQDFNIFVVSKKEKSMELSCERVNYREEKLAKDYGILYSNSIKPAMKEFAEMVHISGFELKKNKSHRDWLNNGVYTRCSYTIIVNNPYTEINFELGVFDNKEGFHLWIDMENEYCQWKEIIQKPISKRIKSKDLLKEIAAGMDKALSLLKNKSETVRI